MTTGRAVRRVRATFRLQGVPQMAAMMRAAAAGGRARAGALGQRRGYHSRGQLTRHMEALKGLADTVAPAHQRHQFQRRSKIVCTIGPKVANEADIEMLMQAGMNVARFNFSCASPPPSPCSPLLPGPVR